MQVNKPSSIYISKAVYEWLKIKFYGEMCKGGVILLFVSFYVALNSLLLFYFVLTLKHSYHNFIIERVPTQKHVKYFLSKLHIMLANPKISKILL